MSRVTADAAELGGAASLASRTAYASTSPCRERDDDWIPLNTLKAGTGKFDEMIVQSARMRQLVSKIDLVAPYKGTVLIQGESGTGKELVANALHRFGPAPKGPLVVFNCSNLLGSLA